MNQEMKLMKTMQCGQVSGEMGGCYLLDVRTPGEYAGVHIEGAELMPLGEMEVERVKGAMGGRRCVVVCQSGMRARKAAERLEAAGVEAVGAGGTTTTGAEDGA
jgi:rhodanese-related sulfurtransferase